MKKKELEMFLERIPVLQTPTPELEQYSTPATIASDVLFLAYLSGDIDGKIVVDLGCGNGIFAIGAKILGARSVVGVEIDANAIEIGMRFSRELGLDVKFVHSSIEDFNESCDTVIQNPPFGSQRKRADRTFLDKAMRIADVIYSLHLSRTEMFVASFATELGGTITLKKRYIFPIRYMFPFHAKEKVEQEVTLFRIEKE